MGTFTNTTQFKQVSEEPAVSRGGAREIKLRGKITGSSSYATGGDTVTVPTITGATLAEVRITAQPPSGTRVWAWDQGTSTPKILAFDAFATQEANATNVSADVLFVELVYTKP